MKTETKILGGILIGTAILLIGGVVLLSKLSTNNPQSTTVVQIDYNKGQKIGSDSARVKLVEFSDFQCPACGAVEPYLKRFRNDYPADVQIIYRHFPLAQHQYARTAATLSEAAGEEEKFWEMHDRIFETQEQWSNLPAATDFFLTLAKELGLEENKVKETLEKDSFKSKIDTDFSEGQRLGVNSTPTFFLNGKKLNLKSFDDLNSAVQEELKK